MFSIPITTVSPHLTSHSVPYVPALHRRTFCLWFKTASVEAWCFCVFFYFCLRRLACECFVTVSTVLIPQITAMTRSCVETSSTSCSSFPSWTTASCASCAASWPVWLPSSRSAGTPLPWLLCSAPTSSSKTPLGFFLFYSLEGNDVAT